MTNPSSILSLLDAFGALKHAPETPLLADILAEADLSPAVRRAIGRRAANLVRQVRAGERPRLMEEFLAEYGLSTREGVALMCLAEALLRVPDAQTIDALIEDKIAPSDWGRHLGRASSSLVNASTWALMLTGRVLEDDQPGLDGVLHGVLRRLGEPVIRVAVARALKELGRQFVLGETIDAALERAREEEERGYTYSFDMLGEAAMTVGDADRYAEAYANAIETIGVGARGDTIAERPGISIKLSALHPRYEVAQRERVMRELTPMVTQLARQACAANIGFNIDAEEQDRLVLSLEVIEAVLSDKRLAGWDGFGVVVQAYGKRAPALIDRLHALAEHLDRHLMVRLVKGAYWDTEMKHAQVEGHADFPLFTRKAATDACYLACIRRLFAHTDRLYPQFATHNAHSAAAVLELADGRPFEFQRLHGMGERLHDLLLTEAGARCRIYAPVGAHRDLLAYLVRRLLENGANSSFVHQIVDPGIRPQTIAADPIARLARARPPKNLLAPDALFGDKRANAPGFDLSDTETLIDLERACMQTVPDAGPLTVRRVNGPTRRIENPATGAPVAEAVEADPETAVRAIDDARPWETSLAGRAETLRRAADLYIEHAASLFAALTQEAGKTRADAIGEWREAIDFLRYYAAEAELMASTTPCGIITAISPWNFPLAIFTGQIAAALATGNAVLAKPAEQTPLIAALAVRLLHQAGVPQTALQLLPGPGETVGRALVSDPRIAGVVFTGSTETARHICREMADHLKPGTPLIAETGGLNAMLVDSTALPEQAVRDIITSAFRSAGQRCSALRCLYLQADVAPAVLTMLKGAMDQLQIGDPQDIATDVGPLIDPEAKREIDDYIATAQARGQVLHQTSPSPDIGCFTAPTLIEVNGLEEIEREVFGPVLHVATFEGDDLDRVIDAVNARGYGLTFGLHTRIDSRVQQFADRLHVGNLYVNRNQIGAVVGSQPFGGEGLSGTGPKAGGPHYLTRFTKPEPGKTTEPWTRPDDPESIQARIAEAGQGGAVDRLELPGPTGESNTLHLTAREPLLCLGPGSRAAAAQAESVRALGGLAVEAAGTIPAEALTQITDLSGVLWWGGEEEARTFAQALATRQGPLMPLITAHPDRAHVAHERHLCIDTTAAGGNAALLGG